MILRAFVSIALVWCVLSASKIVTVTNSTQLESMSAICDAAPVSNLGLCNNTCLQCSSSNSYKCTSCNTQLKLATDLCLLDNNIHTYTIYNYLKDLNPDLMVADIKKFIYADTQATLGPNKVIEVCSANTYEMFFAGIFKPVDIIGIKYTLGNKIDMIQVKLNLMAVVQDITFNVDINDNNIFQKKYNIFSDLSGTYGKNSSSTKPTTLFLDALNSNTVNSVVTSVDTGITSIITNTVQINFYVTSSQTSYAWGFNDLVVIMRACETCVTKEVQDLMDRLVRLTWIVLIIVIGLIVLLFILIKFQTLQRKWNFEAKLGSSDSLPLKAIDRVIDSLHRSTLTMQKEFKREDKRFLKLMKRQ